MDRRADILATLRGQLCAAGATRSARATVSTNLELFDAFASTGGGLVRGAIHEILTDPNGDSIGNFESLLASAIAAQSKGGWIVWSDPAGTLYPPALAKAGVSMDRLLILRPRSPQEELWAIAECLRCAGVAATVARIGKLTPVQARRLQLAVEQGGGIGMLMRPDDARASHYAAATRWRVSSIASELAAPVSHSVSHPASHSLSQRWNVELVYGHGGRIGQSFVLEVDRETGKAIARSAIDPTAAAAAVREGTAPATPANDPVRRAADLADGSRATAKQRSSA